MKRFKLVHHQKSLSEENLLVNLKDFNNVSVGDIVEISSPDGECSPLLLKVSAFPGDVTHKVLAPDTISIEQTIANAFQLKAHAEVNVSVITDVKSVALDSVEVTFKDQYLARSDMWRLKKCLVGTCVHVNEKLEFSEIRCQVFEMYMQGERVASGVVTEDTKIVYRSASSMVYLFIQMSCEMWHFDINGDLYFEKAINGFLPDLFSKWKKLNCNHDVTIVLFSRTFYEAQSSDEFPMYMRECLQQDYKGRFFEDFYRVAVQNERYDDWSSTIISLKKLFNQYLDAVLDYHRRPGVKIPKAVNSTSSQGNFLEVLNMSLNVFEKHYMDRSFDRTGQLSVVISPGVGVFEVDRELTIITKQRIIDNGIGSDLVCLGEQPLHAVPLFKFHNKQNAGLSYQVPDDYNMPHWINLSFYSSTKQASYANFVPRVKLPIPLPEESKESNWNCARPSRRSRHASQPDPSFPVLFDYDEYDNHVFKLPAHAQMARTSNSLQRPSRRKATPPNQSHSVGATTYRSVEETSSRLTNLDPSPSSVHSHASSAAIAIPSRNCHKTASQSSFQNSIDADNGPVQQRIYSKDDTDPEFTPPCRNVIGSAGTSCENQFVKQAIGWRSKALVNPFDPSHITIKLTSNRRRWTHVFPLGPTGIFMQQHHYQAIPQISASTLIALDAEKPALNSDNLLQYRNTISSLELDGSFDSKIGILGKREMHSSASATSLSGMDVKLPSSSIRTSCSSQSTGPQGNRSLTWLWGATGEQEWTPALTTGVDWKSLVIPACLPITTDYFPDKRSLQNDYVISDYFLLPEDNIFEYSRPRYLLTEDEAKTRMLTTSEVYNELICQRLQQGFQIILLSKQHQSYPQVSTSPQFTSPLVSGKQKTEQPEECLLSIGRIFHKLSLDGPQITVTQYRPRHPYREIKIHYCYRFQAPDSDTYGVSWVDFTSEKLENYAWNHLDHYICMRGEREFELKDSLKFWRLRMLLLPGVQPATRKIIEGSECCDLYACPDEQRQDKMQQVEGFLKFVEVMNKIRRLQPRTVKDLPRRPSLGPPSLGQQPRDRVGSNQMPSRTRFRSFSAKMGARVPPVLTGRVSPITDDGKMSVHGSTDTCLEGASEEMGGKKLNKSSSPLEIIDAMKNPQGGLNFLLKQGLPNCTFISAEAVSWAIENIENMDSELSAVKLFGDLLEKELICHASGIKGRTFIHGFYLYYVVPSGGRDPVKGMFVEKLKEEEQLYLFQRDWMEVELSPSWSLNCNPTDEEEEEEELWQKDRTLKFKTMNILIDEGKKSGRLEWGQARYQSTYEPYEAFEIVFQWMVATGNIAADLVQGWARKASSYSLQLVPIPSDPFALPFSNDSDPLRGPIFIPLDLDCLTEAFGQPMAEARIFELQEKILCQFGFIPYRSSVSPSPLRYVHISGSMFVMLPDRPRDSCRKPSGRCTPVLDVYQVSSPHDEYITRHFSGARNKRSLEMNSESETKIGFLYSWNYMITKRWKTAGTVDENFMRKVMRDFRASCANQNNRLVQFYKCLLMSAYPVRKDENITFCLES